MRPLSRLSCHSHTLFRCACAAFIARVAHPTLIYQRCHHCHCGARRLLTRSAFVAPVALLLLPKQRYDWLPPHRLAPVVPVALRWRWDHGRRANRCHCLSTRQYDRLAPCRLSSQDHSTRVGGAANTSLLTQLVRKLPFLCPRDCHDRDCNPCDCRHCACCHRDCRISSLQKLGWLLHAPSHRSCSPSLPRAIDGGGRSVCPPQARCYWQRIRALSFKARAQKITVNCCVWSLHCSPCPFSPFLFTPSVHPTPCLFRSPHLKFDCCVSALVASRYLDVSLSIIVIDHCWMRVTSRHAIKGAIAMIPSRWC